jgi:hypothetical protein
MAVQAPREVSRYSYGRRAEATAAHALGLIGGEAVLAGPDVGGEAAVADAHHHLLFCFQLLFFRSFNIAIGPAGDDGAHVEGVFLVAQQVVATVERDVAFGVPGGHVDLFGVVDAHDGVLRGVEDEQCLAEIFQRLGHVLLRDIVYELFS